MEEKEVLEPKEEKSEREINAEVQQKIQKQIDKKQAQQQKLGIYRIGAYLKEEHKWDNYLFLAVSVLLFVLGLLFLNDTLTVNDSFPLIGGHTTAVGVTLTVIGALAILYALWPFVKPAIPEFRKITWLDKKTFIGNIIRTFVFILIFVGLFILYDYLITGILGKIL